MPFGQLVIGPPGSGKTTYCNGVSQYLTALGRKVALINLDPANDVLPYSPTVDVSDLVDLEAVMANMGLGPNGGMLYCMEYLAANLDWLQERLEPLAASNHYFIFDCPGQVELFTGQDAFKQVLEAVTSQWHYRLAAVHLVDAHLATDASKYLSALLLSLSTMLHLELPQVNVLSKVDLVPHYGRLAFNLEYYTQVQDLTYLIASMGRSPFTQRFRKLSQGLADVVEGYGLVGFTPLAIQDQASLSRLVGQVDKANGACYAQLDRPPVPVPAELLAASGHTAAEDDVDADLQEKYIDSSGGGCSGGLHGDSQQQQHQQHQQQKQQQQHHHHHHQQQQQQAQLPGLMQSVHGKSGGMEAQPDCQERPLRVQATAVAADAIDVQQGMPCSTVAGSVGAVIERHL